jgi:hypothetical protein
MTSVLVAVEFTVTVPKSRVVELTDMMGAGAGAVASDTLVGELDAFDPMAIAALSADNVEGVNKAVMMQLAFGATAVQLFVCEKSAALVPENATPVTVSGAFPVFVRVRGKDDELPGPVGGKFSDA